MMRKFVFGLLFFTLVAGIGSLKAQYTTGIGIRGALGPGLTLKHHLTQDHAVEIIAVGRWRGVLATGLYEVHFPALQVPNLRWYVGGGGHFGIWSQTTSTNPWFTSEGGVVIGLDVIGGIEYTLPSLPINFSLDYKPGFNLIGTAGFWADDAALSIRYVF